MFFAGLQSLIVLVISIVALVASIYAVIHAGRTPDGAFKAAGKQSKAVWLIVTLAAALIAFISLPAPLGRGGGTFWILGLVALAAVIFYLVDVKPKVDAHRGQGPTHRNTGTW